MNPKNRQVDAYLAKSKWQPEMNELRAILLSSKLTEEFKWSQPCYSFQEHNLIVMQGFKKHCALLFMKGVLLKDPEDILIKTGANTHVGRQIRFTSVQKILHMKKVLKSYIDQAIKIEKAGVRVKSRKTSELEIPEEFQRRLYEMPELKEAFEALTPGRQKGYIFYFSAAKQPKTREARIDKCIDMILDGEGLNDDYLSKSKSKTKFK